MRREHVVGLFRWDVFKLLLAKYLRGSCERLKNREFLLSQKMFKNKGLEMFKIKTNPKINKMLQNSKVKYATGAFPLIIIFT